ncbi:hypothetical protein B7494_g513 [Chlorociboria aeruginascens]|nr:hypothetical protein B7494_g513 [Chlorociboria aeruginascens]
MALLGLSILIASISFLCYRHLPSSWTIPCRRWFGQPRIGDVGNAPENTVSDGTKEYNNKTREKEGAPELLILSTKAELDRKAMPPPPIFKKPTRIAPRSPPTITASTPPSVPTDPPSPSSIPSFPAINSVQRASGGRGPSGLNPGPAIQPPLRSVNGGLMALPSRSPLPNRSPTSNSSSSLSLPPTHSSKPAKPRQKVELTPGHSPLDWARLTSSPDANLRGVPASTPYLRVPPSLLRQYMGRKGNDAWTVLGGKVYNITPYMAYHPGGAPELMKAAGRDGTRLFGEIHPWVNYEGMLEGCLIGLAVEEGITNTLEEMD